LILRGRPWRASYPWKVRAGADAEQVVRTDVVVIGAGQAGLSAAHGLRSAGLEPGARFVVLDGEEGPGGAWQHRWPMLRVDGAHRISDLPEGARAA
jgi:cation diffusion facilitator CzcD-associated flavoprotein CzcO